MAQISDVMHALAVLDAARQELAWAYSGDFTDVPEPMKGAVHTILEVLNEAEMRWVTSTREEEPMAAVVDKENGMAVVATGHEEKKKKKKKKKREDVRVVKEVDMRSIGEAEKKIKDWLLRLEEVACDMRAVAHKELLGDYSMIDDKPSARWLPCLPRTSRAARIIAPAIDTVALKLEELKKQYDEFGYSTGLPLAATCTEQPACSSAAVGQEERETSVTGDVLVERGDDVKQRIIGITNGDRNSRGFCSPATILPIVGPPCVGKTTLVKSVFHEGSFGPVYKVWVNMRKGWDIKKILKSIVDVLGRHGINDRENHIRKMESERDYDYYINNMMANSRRRLLLVFDNLVEEQDSSMLEKLLKFLHGRIGSVVIAIVTTRSEALAKYITCFRGTTVKPYRLHPSSDDMCWEIIKRTSGHDLEAIAAGNSEAAAVAGQIANKCSGIPLAAKALGRFLQSVDPQEWPGLIRDVWNIGGGFSRDSQHLRRLPIHSATVFTHLKHSSGGVLEVGAESWLSLAYCAFVFPKGKGHGVVTRDLLNQWCSLGITTRERGASCISELLDRSLLLGEKPASADGEDEILPATLLTMEDLMHDFARYHLGDRLIIMDGTNGAAPPTSSSPVNNNKSSGARLALVSNFDAKQQLDIASTLPAAGILALRFEGCGEMELSEVEFASAKYACLRLLDLGGCSVKKLPDSIRHLKQLRYLRAPGITGLSPDQEFPRSITGLHELRYLILHGSCQLKDLTEAFQRLSNLLHLDLSGCSGLKVLPDSFGRLWRLEHLDLSACSGIEALPESFCWLRNLSHLDLSRCSGLQDLPTSFQYLTELRHLDLSGLSRLQALPMVSLPRELRHLNLSCSGLQEKLPDAPEPNELRHLDLSECSSVRYLPSSYAKLEKLVHLNLSGCSSLIKLPRVGGPEGGEWTRKLEHLDLSHCSQLTDMPHNSDLPKLQYLDLLRCYQIRESPPYLVISDLVETIRSRGGRASEPQDVRGLGTNGTTN